MNNTDAPTLSDSELILQGRNYAYGFTRNFHDAEDLAQQAWLKLKKKYEEVKDRGLLFRAIRNLFIDGTRRAKIVQFEALDDYDFAIGKRENLATAHDLDSVLSVLNENERKCVYLNFIQGYTATEISEQTGMPRGTILSHTHRAKKKLLAHFRSEMALDDEAAELAASA